MTLGNAAARDLSNDRQQSRSERFEKNLSNTSKTNGVKCSGSRRPLDALAMHQRISDLGRPTGTAGVLQAGSVVVIAARTECDPSDMVAVAGNGDRLFYVHCDVSQEKDVAALMDTTASRWGRIDMGINNAGVETRTLCPTADLSESIVDEIMNTNLRGVWLTMKHALQHMQQRHARSGAIVNIPSVNGLGGTPNQSLYSAAKARVLALTKAAAQEYAEYGIRVNAVVPGAIDTPML